MFCGNLFDFSGPFGIGSGFLLNPDVITGGLYNQISLVLIQQMNSRIK